MQYRRLGDSGLMVPTLTLGTATFGNMAVFGNTDEVAARHQIDMCLDVGLNLFDTADGYSAGLSERILGAAIAGRRDRVLISTKVSNPMGDGPNDRGLSRHHIRDAVNASLRRLRTDYIDIYHLHGWDGLTPIEETVRTLDELVTAGKVRYLGVSNFAGWQLMKALAAADRGGYERMVSNQIYYSLESRDADYELIPASIDQGVGVLAWSPLAGGLLSGKYRRGVTAESGRHVLGEWNEPPVRNADRLYDVIEKVVEIADGHGLTAAQVSLAYILTRPGITSLVIGARTSEQLSSNLGAADVELTDEEIAVLDALSAPVLTYPHWHQARYVSDRFGVPEQALHGFGSRPGSTE